MIRFTKSFFFIYYRFIKSGFLLDFFVKRWVISLSFIFFYVFNVVFNEKYFIENIFFRLVSVNRYLRNFISVFSNNFSYVVFPLIIIFVVLSFFFLYLVTYVIK